MFRYRLAYQKIGRLRFLSHLEICSTLFKAIRRSKLPIKLTEGFSPHPKITFGPALPVSTASQEEWMDIFLKIRLDPEIVILKLNETLPPEITIICCFLLPENASKLNKDLQIAHYYIYLNNNLTKSDQELIKKEIGNFLKKDEIVINRREKEIIVKPSQTCSEIKLNSIDNKFFLDLYLRLNIKNILLPDDILNIILSNKQKNRYKAKIKKIEHFLEISDNLIKVKDFYKKEFC